MNDAVVERSREPDRRDGGEGCVPLTIQFRERLRLACADIEHMNERFPLALLTHRERRAEFEALLAAVDVVALEARDDG